MAGLLISRNVKNQTQKTKEEITPVGLAAKSGNKEMVSFLISKGASIKTKNNNGEFAFLSCGFQR